MRTTNFSQILFDALQYSGNDRYNISKETFGQFRDFINARMREAWESSEWQDLCRVAQFTATTDSNGVPSFTPATDCGEILGVYNYNPLTTDRATSYTYTLYDDGTTSKVVLNSTTISTGWYYYRTKVPNFNGDLWNPLIAYKAGSQVYWDSGSSTATYTPVEGFSHTGNFYTCIADTNAGQSPATNSTKWSVITIPYIFGPYLAWGAGANWFASEAMMQEAGVFESKAQQMLDNEIDKISRQQQQIPKLKFTNPYR